MCSARFRMRIHSAYKGILETGQKIEANHLIFGILTLFYMFVPAHRVRFRTAFPGSLFTTLVWTGLTLLFQYYVDNFIDYSLFYDALGTMVALILWVQLISTIILLGVEINALLMRKT